MLGLLTVSASKASCKYKLTGTGNDTLTCPSRLLTRLADRQHAQTHLSLALLAQLSQTGGFCKSCKSCQEHLARPIGASCKLDTELSCVLLAFNYREQCEKRGHLMRARRQQVYTHVGSACLVAWALSQQAVAERHVATVSAVRIAHNDSVRRSEPPSGCLVKQCPSLKWSVWVTSPAGQLAAGYCNVLRHC